MVAVIGLRFLTFALATLGAISPPLNTSGPLNSSGSNLIVMSWIVPVVMPLIMITLVLIFRRRGPMPLMSKHASDDETPLEILKRRFARGEITKEQYEDMKRTLLEEGHSRS
jgi:putative membrane protein